MRLFNCFSAITELKALRRLMDCTCPQAWWHGGGSLLCTGQNLPHSVPVSCRVALPAAGTLSPLGTPLGTRQMLLLLACLHADVASSRGISRQEAAIH